MTYIKKDLESKILSLSGKYSAVLIIDPRQVWKTAILRRLMQGSRTYVILDDLEKRAMAQNDPALFLQLQDRPLLIDEVQYARSFSHILKSRLTAKRNRGVSGSLVLRHFV